ncbi:hypothetical protein BV898_12485 [Hypsibius exemplaris]|uniref:3'-5' exonuclease domain-containing protein n=1 Tax=Hypsibius exemplaris TaxID=2072580 RepID=A0A1W0WDK4_HYPEX|nr:hypothetical protein BV898_12485 [Hypsibius exemplaris]
MKNRDHHTHARICRRIAIGVTTLHFALICSGEFLRRYSQARLTLAENKPQRVWYGHYRQGALNVSAPIKTSDQRLNNIPARDTMQRRRSQAYSHHEFSGHFGPNPDVYQSESELIASFRSKLVDVDYDLEKKLNTEHAIQRAPHLDQSTDTEPPFMMRVHHPDPYDLRLLDGLPALRSDTDGDPGGLKQIELELALQCLVTRCDAEQLHLNSLEKLLWLISDLPDDVTGLDGDSEYGGQDYATCYFIMDDEKSLPFLTALKFLLKQKTLSFTFHSVKDDCCSVPSHPVCAVFATTHYVFLFDLEKLGASVISAVVKPILEDQTVHKLVHDAPAYLRILRDNYGSGINNYYDVAEIESLLDDGIVAYTLLEFRRKYEHDVHRKYESQAHVFRRFPDRHFLCLSRPQPHLLVENWSLSELEDTIKHTIYLGVIKQCQVGRLFWSASLQTEQDMMGSYSYQPEWSVGATESPDSGVGWNLEPRAVSLPQEENALENKEEVLECKYIPEENESTDDDDDDDDDDDPNERYEPYEPRVPR